MAPKIIITSSEGVIEEFGKILTIQSQKAIKNREKFIVGFSGGSMPSMLGKMEKFFKEWQLDKWYIWLVDERITADDDSDSNHGTLSKEFYSKLPSQPHIYTINQTLLSEGMEQEVANDYEEQMRSSGLFSQGPIFDCLFLGQGPDGHTASLFPGHSLTMYQGSRWIQPITDSPKPPPRRITLTLPVLNLSRCNVFVVTGSGKKDVVREVLEEGSTELPSGLVKGHELIWLLDTAAASGLKKKSEL